MRREYTIEIMEFVGVYFPSLSRVKVEAACVEDAIYEALNDVGAGVSPEELEYAKENINEDDYNVMFNPRSNDYIAIAYNYVLDQYQSSGFRLLRGYCGKRKCFDITIKDEYSINK
ncbi:MAG: hypothetical protein J6S67_03095 [Methanobrevibacter sp.]|nr:hypothetical protein [Methanobrevibacter sp.]